MSGPNVGLGTHQVAFFDPQAAYTTPNLYPVAADAVRVLSWTVDGKSPREAREDKFLTGTRIGSISMKKTVAWTMEVYAYTSGAVGTAPDWSDLLLDGAGMQQTSGTGTTVSGGGSTTTVIDVVDASGFTVGGALVISGELRRITAKDTVPTPNTVTITPALSAAPADAVTVSSALSYRPDDDRSNLPKSGTLWLGNNSHLWRLTGAVAESLTFSGGGDGAARIQFSGFARASALQFPTTMNDSGGISDSDVSMTVTNGKAIPDDVSATNPYYIQIESEIIKVTAKSTNTLTIARAQLSSSAVAHADALVIDPYQPAGTYAGEPVPATGGICKIASVTTPVETWSVGYESGAVQRVDQHGDANKVAGFVQGMRAVTPTLSGWSFYDTAMLHQADAVNRTAVQAFAQQGDTAGSLLAVECPTVRFQVASFDGNADEVRLELTGEAEGTTAKEDEFFLLVG